MCSDKAKQGSQEKYLSFIIAKIYGFVLREIWNCSFKEWNRNYIQQDKLLLWGYLFYYVIFIYKSPGTLFLQLSHTVWNFRSYRLCSTNTFLCRKHPLSTVKSGGQPAFISSFFENLSYKGYRMKDTNKTLMTRASDLKQQEHSSSSLSISAKDCINMSTSVYHVV